MYRCASDVVQPVDQVPPTGFCVIYCCTCMLRVWLFVQPLSVYLAVCSWFWLGSLLLFTCRPHFFHLTPSYSHHILRSLLSYSCGQRKIHSANSLYLWVHHHYQVCLLCVHSVLHPASLDVSPILYIHISQQFQRSPTGVYILLMCVVTSRWSLCGDCR